MTNAQKATVSDAVRHIASALKETKTPVLALIRRNVQIIGVETALTRLQEAQTIQDAGGMKTLDGTAQRTFGGVWFRLVKEGATPEQREKMCPPKPVKSLQAIPPQPIPSPIATPSGPRTLAPVTAQKQPPFASVPTQNPQQSTTKGQATTVKITIIGRPGMTRDFGTYVVAMIESTKVPALPKGLPALNATPTLYAVRIAAKQWNKVKDAIAADDSDTLIIEGYPTLDVQNSLITVSASSVKSKKQDIAAKVAQKAQQETLS